MSTQPSTIIAIYDNGGKTLDRYTFYLNKKHNGLYTSCFVTDDYGRGVSQFSEGQLGRHNGKKIAWEQVNQELQQHVINRLQEASA